MPFIAGNPRVPVFTGTDAQRSASTTNIAGDLWSTTDTQVLWQYSGSAWAQVTPQASDIKLLASGSWQQAATAEADLKTIAISSGTFAAIDTIIVRYGGTAQVAGGAFTTAKVKIVSGSTVTSTSTAQANAQYGEWIIRQSQDTNTNCDIIGSAVYHAGAEVNGNVDYEQSCTTANWITGAFSIVLRATVANQTCNCNYQIYKARSS